MTQDNQKPTSDTSRLTANQQGLFFLQQQHKDCFAYNIPICLKISTVNLQSAILRQACQLFVDQQPALRTTFGQVDGVAIQSINPDSIIDFEQKDLTDAAKDPKALESILYQTAHQPFDLEHDPICRFRVFDIGQGQHIFLMVVHHIIFDGFSSLLVNQIFDNYQRLADGQPINCQRLKTSFNDYRKQQKNWIKQDVAIDQLTFWQQQMAALPQLALPMDKPLPPQQTFDGHSVPFTIAQETANRLKAMVKKEKITLSTVCLAVYKLMLHQYTNQDDLIVGMPVLGRDLNGLDKTVGYFVNMLPVRTHLDVNQPFNKFLRQLTEQVWLCLANRDYPFVKLVENLAIDRNISRPPVFQVSYAFQHFSSWANTGFTPMVAGCQQQFGDLSIQSEPLHCQEGVFELALEILWHDEGEIQGFLKYNTNLFEHQTVERMVGHYQNILDAIVDNPAQTLGDVSHVDGDLQMQISQLDYSSYVGIIGIGRVTRGTVNTNQQVTVVGADGKTRNGKVGQVLGYLGLERFETKQGSVGDIVAITGLGELKISDTICAQNNIDALPPLSVDEPTVTMTFQVNTSPFAGLEGKFVTSRNILERLEKELVHNVALRVETTEDPDKFKVSGRGELHLGILIENMRREGFELAVSRPEVIVKDVDGVKMEPFENLTVDVEEEHQGTVMERLGTRKAELTNMVPDGKGRVRLDFIIPSRGLIGFQTEFMTITSGSGLLYHTFERFDAHKGGDIGQRMNGVLISIATGKALTYALFNLQERGRLFAKHADEVYEGQVIGIHTRSNDLTVNCLKGKQLTNVRASGTDEAQVLSPPIVYTLEQALEFIDNDELVEVTPKSIRIRKKLLSENERKRANRAPKGE